MQFTGSLFTSSVSGILFFNDKNRIVTVSHDATAKVYNIKTKQQLRRVADMGDMAISSCILLQPKPSENWIVGSSWDNKVFTY